MGFTEAKRLEPRVNKTVEILNIQNEVNDLTFSTKFIMKTVKEKIDVRAQEEWYDELFTDRGNQNGNKLRTYRQFKQIRCTETYVSRLVHIVSTCYGSVPRRLTLAIETGRYAKPPVPVENRLCVVCNKNCVETENHFLLDCPLYDDLRLILFFTMFSLLKVLTV